MHIHILGICGTFMGGLAILARQLGHQVSGSDTHCYPPMSTQLEQHGIQLMQGYKPEHLDPEPDCVVIGNALSRGNPAVEYVLNRGLSYTSGPAFLAEHLLKNRWVLAVAGTHGKTTTSSMLAWILEYAGLKPGFLIGGVANNFDVSARQGELPFFVVEADEYDSAFFDKRSKFIHYHPRTAVLNNLEFDHADIFDDLAAIKKQFHHFVRTIPGNGLIISPADDHHLNEVLHQGCWTAQEQINAKEKGWRATNNSKDDSRFDVCFDEQRLGHVDWPLIGRHNVNNALTAIAAARHAGVMPRYAIEALNQFKGVKRRMEISGCVDGITVYDDFAHHPTAIATTLAGLRHRVGNAQIIVALEPRSNTMRMGVHQQTLARSLAAADLVLFYQPDNMSWDIKDAARHCDGGAKVFADLERLIKHTVEQAQPGAHIVVMSNGAFGGIHGKLLAALQQR